jgi:hypothetical protein
MPDPSVMLTNGVKLVGESLLPGASLLMDGRFGEGAIHAVIGYGARIFLGPLGLVIVAADSFSKSVTDQNLWDYIPRYSLKRPAAPASPATAEEAPKA